MGLDVVPCHGVSASIAQEGRTFMASWRTALPWFLTAPVVLHAFGCASVTGGRPSVPSGVRTITAIGDRTVAVASGEPGETVTAPMDAPGPPPAPSRRISGRVLDEQGRPVPGATVRLAVDGSPAGRSVRTTTDEAGRFALANLRSGSTYSLIAEWEDESGAYREGRLAVEAPRQHVEIVLQGNDPEQEPHVRTASSGASADLSNEDLPDADEPAERDEPPGRVEEADDLPERSETATAVWRRKAEVAEPEPSQSAPAFRPTLEPAEEEEGPNPLPPALERPPVAPASSEARPAPLEADSSVGSGPAPPEFPPDSAPSSMPGAADEATGLDPRTQSEPSAALIDQALSANSPAASPPPAATAPVFPPLTESDGPEVVPENAAPAPATDTQEVPRPEQEPAAPSPSIPVMEESGAAADGPADFHDPEPDPNPDTVQPAGPSPPGAEPSSEARNTRTPGGGPTWGEVAAASASDRQLIPSRQPPLADRDALPGDSREPARTASNSSRIACQYDARLRRLIDFTLPDVDGNPVRFRDLDADLVLLDFWGTWCAPCVRSVPHLIALQEQYGDRLRIVGIAYEQGEARERAAAVAATARRLGINYTLLLGGTDGKPCPVQSQLHVQVYPTMILLDRQGHLLWRDQGATPETLARLDRVIASQARAVIARR
jgi:thiol-disulfide isomerase/thioredoxin